MGHPRSEKWDRTVAFLIVGYAYFHLHIWFIISFMFEVDKVVVAVMVCVCVCVSDIIIFVKHDFHSKAIKLRVKFSVDCFSAVAVTETAASFAMTLKRSLIEYTDRWIGMIVQLS